jgi:hypothetical protein
MKRYWTITLGTPLSDKKVRVLSVPKAQGRTPDGQPKYSGERAVCLFDSEEAARAFWQESGEFDVSEYRKAQSEAVNFFCIAPSGLAEYVLTVGHPYVVVNPSVFVTQERSFWRTEEFLDSL